MSQPARAEDHRQLTIEMWRWIGTRRYLADFTPDGERDGKCDGTATGGRGHIQLVREE